MIDRAFFINFKLGFARTTLVCYYKIELIITCLCALATNYSQEASKYNIIVCLHFATKTTLTRCQF